MEEIVRSVVIPFLNDNVDVLTQYYAKKTELEDIVIAAGAVTSVHGRRGNVVSQAGDYTAEQVGAAEKIHAAQHKVGGTDAIAPQDIGAATADHTHGNITNDGKVGAVNGKILMTGVGGLVEAKDTKELGFITEPILVATSGAISITVEDNREYEYTGVTSLNMVGADVECHGTIVFAAATPSISVTGFTASGGDDIAEAKASETWEFSVYKNKIIWKNWG